VGAIPRALGRVAMKLRPLALFVLTVVVAFYIERILEGETHPADVWQSFSGFEVPLWSAIALVLLLAAAGWSLGALSSINTRVTPRRPPDEEWDRITTENAELRQLARRLQASIDTLRGTQESDEVARRLIADVLQYSQRLLAGELDPTDQSRAIEKGILEPVAASMSEETGASVRLAVLRSDGAFHYRIGEQAGWGLGADEFAWDQARPLEELGFERDEAVMTRSVTVGDRTTGVLIALCPKALNDRYDGYLGIVAATVGIIESAAAQEESQP
jgi:hypothetical protein